MSSVYQYTLPNFDPLRRLGEVERIFAKVFLNCTPSRPTLISMCQDGTLDAIQLGRGRNWFVYQSSIDKFITDTQRASQQKLAA